jgi:hypothetical protein
MNMLEERDATEMLYEDEEESLYQVRLASFKIGLNGVSQEN